MPKKDTFWNNPNSSEKNNNTPSKEEILASLRKDEDNYDLDAGGYGIPQNTSTTEKTPQPSDGSNFEPGSGGFTPNF